MSQQILSEPSILWNKRYAIPQEKGAWVWWIGPFFIGVAAAGQLTFDIIPLFTAALAGFMLRQPLTLLVKILCGRAHPRNLAPAAIWLAIYSLLLVMCSGLLLARGYTWILGMAALVAPLILWHEWLVTRGDERQQPIIDHAAAAIAGSTAPAAYWICQGSDPLLPWMLWLLSWQQSSASITHMFLRLQQRHLENLPSKTDRWKMGAIPLAHHALGLAISVWAAMMGWVPGWIVVAFVITMTEGVSAVASPQFGAAPRELGMRQLGISIAFFLMVIIGYLI